MTAQLAGGHPTTTPPPAARRASQPAPPRRPQLLFRPTGPCLGPEWPTRAALPTGRCADVIDLSSSGRRGRGGEDTASVGAQLPRHRAGGTATGSDESARPTVGPP